MRQPPTINTINFPRGDYDRGVMSWNPITDTHSPEEQSAPQQLGDYMKRCRTCRQRKRVSLSDRQRSEFYLYKNRVDGRYLPLSDCKPCHYELKMRRKKTTINQQ